MSKVICEKCRTAGLRSRVTESYGAITSMPIWPDWDEDGQYHYHDPNIHGSHYECSNRHRWSTSYELACPAGDYGGADTQKVHWREDAPKPEPYTLTEQVDGVWVTRTVVPE